MAGAFPQVKVETSITYPALKSKVEEDISVASGLMKELVRHESPGSMPFIDWNGNGWKLEDGKLTVCVSSAEGMAYLKSRGIDRLFLCQRLRPIRRSVNSSY